jgi:uncharacterized membrane protein
MEAVFFWAIVGNTLPVFFLLKYLEPAAKWLIAHSKRFDRFLTKVFETSRAKHSLRFERIGALVLFLVVAIPFPGSGAWTAAILAYLFNVPYWKAFVLIFCGITGAAVIVSLAVESAIHLPWILRYFLGRV